MEDLDMSRPGGELFPESTPQQYNSYADDNFTDHAVGDPLDMGVVHEPAVAGQVEGTEQQKNFRALREEVAKMQSEREYWKGQAEALTKTAQQKEAVQADPYASIDWDDSSEVKKAFYTLRQESERQRNELYDSLKAVETKAERQDWNKMVTEHVPSLTSKNPIFAEMIQNASNPYEAAYLLAELNARASQPTQQAVPQQIGNGQRAMHNASKPQPLAMIGGRGQLNAADMYATMSDKDFMELASRNMANI